MTDICAFWIGCYILRAIYVSICFAFDHILTEITDFLLKYILIRITNALLFSIWTMLTPIKCFATKAWRRKFERIRSVGINKLPSMWLLRDVIGSIINTLLTTLSIPYVLVKSLLPLLGYSQSFNAATERFIWPASLALIVVWFVIKLTLEIITYLHQLIFNELYMVGERVGDLTEDL
ncbi:hypothetical protein Bca52824_066844 [Brassica carinata]|uniref:E3 ubiquitin-protein ligase MARCHF6-like C-terminal domain-containing protein n=1 Tax=Brassica carinata TaxID=52824 RepID=A0A8X7QS25_BRACI|nr:hypothetical protein Bca52824_066844 [Brassica carinata]